MNEAVREEEEEEEEEAGGRGGMQMDRHDKSVQRPEWRRTV